MRVSGFWTLMGAIITGLIIADLWYNKSVTNNLISAGTKESSLIAGRG
jgi:hypothetical protein